MAYPVSLWLSDPAWMAMDATARGFHAHLLLVAARAKPAGVLPNDEAKWRKWLGLPPEQATPGEDLSLLTQGRKTGPRARGPLPDALVSGLQALTSNSPQALAALQGGVEPWINHLWTHLWRDQVLAAWQPIDGDLVAEHPHLAGSEGQWWSPVAAALAHSGASPSLQMGSSPAVGAKPVKKRATKKSKETDAGPPPVLQTGEPADESLLFLTHDSTSWRALESVIVAWRAAALSDDQRQTVWDLGVSCLLPASKNAREARSFLGRLIKTHGEEAVASAVGELSRRVVRPADARSFLTGILTRATEGSAADKKARDARARVAL